MKKYRQTLINDVMAEPMTYGEAKKVIGGENTDGHVECKEGEEGYLVRTELGNLYWLTKSTFVKLYKPYDALLDRLRLEYAELKERLFKLINFIMSEEFRELPKKKQVDLAMQRKAMSHYLGVLAVRIDGEKAEMAGQKAKEEEPVQCKGMIDDLLGCMIVTAGKCDFCPNKDLDCKKLILADGTHICCVRLDKNICDDNQKPKKINFTE
jgi:hypothetical protein